MSNGPWGISMKKSGGQMLGCLWTKLLPSNRILRVTFVTCRCNANVTVSRDQWVSFTVFIVVIKEWNVIWVGLCHFLGGFRVFWCDKFDREQPSGMMTGDIKHQHRHHHRDSKWASCPWRQGARGRFDLKRISLLICIFWTMEWWSQLWVLVQAALCCGPESSPPTS